MEVRFNKRDYLDDEFLDRIVWPHMFVYLPSASWNHIKNFFLQRIKEQIERGNAKIDVRSIARQYDQLYPQIQCLYIEPIFFEIERLYKRYYLMKYVDVLTGIPEIINCISYWNGKNESYTNIIIRSRCPYRNRIYDIMRTYSLKELQEMVFKHRVLPLHQLFGHYLGNYILETHIVKSL